MGAISFEQYTEIRAPRKSEIVAITVDSTTRAYDISTLAIAGETSDGGLRRRSVALWMQAETNDVFFFFSSATDSGLDDAAALSAGSATISAYVATHCAVLEAGNAPIRVRIDREKDKFLIVTAASTSGIIRFWAASEST